MTEDNWSRQADEIEALSSIYGDDWHVDDQLERRYSITISNNLEKPAFQIQLKVMLIAEYPSDAPPIYEIHATWLNGEERLELEHSFENICQENSGECVIFQLINTIREFLEEKAASHTFANAEFVDSSPVTSPDVYDVKKLEQSLPSSTVSDEECYGEEDDEYGFDPTVHVYQPDDNLPVNFHEHDEEVPLPVIHHGEKVYDRKSIFLGHLAAITHKKQVKMVLDSLKENRKIAAATHNIYAYRIDGGRGVFLSGCEDDGEIHAGSRMLHLLNIMDARNVMVVVTRWYGGIHLGPDRFKHINNCTRDLLDIHGYIKDKSDKKGPKSSAPTSQQQKKKKR